MLVKILISTRCQTRNIISLSKPIKWLRPLNKIMLIFLHYLTLLSVRLFLMFHLRFHLQLYQGLFPIKLGVFHLRLLLKLVINLFLRPLAFALETLLLSIYTILPNHSHLILLVKFKLNWNITLFVKLSCRLNPLL